MHGHGHEESSLWLASPIKFHSSREYMCEFNTTWQCDFQTGYWRFWYEADHRYGLPTIAFFMTGIILFSFGYLATQLLPRSVQRERAWQKSLTVVRYLSYRGIRIGDWNSPPVGIMALGVVGLIYFLAMMLGSTPYYWPNTDEVSYGNTPPIAARSGWLSLACMPFVFATASKANWITLLTGIAHEKLQVFHRWIAYAFLVTALVHTFPFIVHHIWVGDMQYVVSTDVFYWTGIAALVAQGWLTFASFSPLRNLAYEFFKVSHFAMVIIFVVTLFWHCGGTLTSWDYFVAVAAIYVPCFCYSSIKTYYEHGFRKFAHLSLTPNDFIRVAVPVDFEWAPGQHCFLRFPSFRHFGLHALTSHPFTICSLPNPDTTDGTGSELVFYIRARNGFTNKLAQQVLAQPDALRRRVLIEGPYGGIDPQKLSDSERVVVVAGGSGSGWTLALVEMFARRLQALSSINTSKTDDVETEKAGLLTETIPSSMHVVIATRDAATKGWYVAALNEVLARHPSSLLGERLTIDIHHTTGTKSSSRPLTHSTTYQADKEQSEVDVEKVASDSSASSDVSPVRSNVKETSIVTSSGINISDYSGRPELASLISQECAQHSKEAVGFFVCGPASMQHDVRNACAGEQLKPRSRGGVYLHMEHFSWA